MPSTPTSKSQVQAYRFVIRRMQSALVRKDAVMLHDPMRTHSRATMVGVALAIVGLAGFLVVGLLNPANPKPSQGILISAQSGRVYVYAGKPATLIPTFNVASARLIYAAIQQQGKSGKQGQQSGANANQAVVAAQTVDDEALQKIPVGRLTGIADGPDLIPTTADQRATGKWAVCDEVARSADLNNPTAQGNIKTTALAGISSVGDDLKQDQGLLVEAPDQQTYLIYRTPSTINQDPNSSLRGSDAVRAKIDLNDDAVNTAFSMTGVRPRPVSTALLNAIPQVGDLTIPDIPGKGSPDNFGLNIKIGGVFSVTDSSGQPMDYVVLQDGIEHVSQSVATVIRAKIAVGNINVPVRQLAQITPITKRPGEIQVSNFPDQIPNVLNANTFPTVCLGWSANTSDPKFPKEHTEVTVGKQLPIPDKAAPVRVGTPNADGVKVDAFWMPPGKAAVVHSAQGPATFKNGPLFLVSSRGTKYGVPDQRTANIVGFTDPVPAPASIVGLLPSGVELTMRAAQKTYDSFDAPANSGSYPPAAAGAANGAGAN